MKLSDSIFTGQDLSTLERRYQRSEKSIFVGPHSGPANHAVISAVDDMEKMVNLALKESGVRMEVSAHWTNIFDSELNPDGNQGHLQVVTLREKPTLSREEIYEALGELINRIEACGASPQLTNAVVLASDIKQSIGNRYNTPNEFAANCVRQALGD